MRLVFLESALDDLEWYRHYYASVFPAGETNASRRFAASVNALLANPYLGTQSQSAAGVRELSIPKTPFRLIYRVTDSRTEIMRLRDERSDQ